MKIPKIPLWTFALVLCGGLTLQAGDTPVQAAARAAMLQKMNELEANPPPAAAPAAPANAPVVEVTPAGAVAPAASAKSSSDEVILTPVSGKHARVKVNQTATTATTSGGEDSLKLEHPFMWRLLHGGRDLNTNTARQASAPAGSNARHDAGKPVVTPKAPPMASQSAAANSAAEQADRAKLEAEKAARIQAAADLKAKHDAEKKLAEQRAAAAKAALAVSQKPATPTAPAVVKNLANPPGFQPMPVPPSPLPLTKEEKLNWLLSRYKTDQITPEEYHKQRAALLAEP